MISDPAPSLHMPNRHPLSGSEILEPTPLPDRSPTDHARSRLQFSPTRRLVLSRWLGEPEAGSYGRLPRPREPFDRLKFWTVSHELTHRLKPYQATAVSLMFRQASWATLAYWSMLLDGMEIEEPAKV